MATPADALRLLGLLLDSFSPRDELFITARADSTMSMWTTSSRAAGLYWCATALSQLWQKRPDSKLPPAPEAPASDVVSRSA